MGKQKQAHPLVSSPASTGAAGTYFEQHACASLLAMLLVRGIPPICTDSRVIEVHLQTEWLGWNTDDFLVVGETDSRHQRRLIGQVKRSLTVSYSDSDFKDAILDAWRDFCRGSNFNRDTDHFVVVTLQGSSTLLRFFTALLDCARNSTNGTEFEHRLTLPGFHDKKVSKYCDEVRKVLDECEARSVTYDELRDFLSFVYLLSWDLNTATAQTEALIKNLLAHTSNQDDPITDATDSWNALLQIIGTGTPVAASYRRADLPTQLLEKHTPISAADDAAIQALRDRSALVLAGIRTVIGNDTHICRAGVIANVLDDIERVQAVLVTGEAGGGKSGVAKNVVDELTQGGFVFAFRAEEFAASHLDSTLADVHHLLTAARLRTLLAAHDRKTILVESVERLLEASNRGAFTDLMTMVSQDPTWRLILTCRDYSADLVRSSFLEFAGLPHSVISVPPLSEGELLEVQQMFPYLARPLGSFSLRSLLKNPYFLDMAARLTWPVEAALPPNERSLRKKFWREVVRDESHAGNGMPQRRERTFTGVALHRARALTAFVPSDEFDTEAIDRLKAGGLLRSSRNSRALVAAAHDVLEDWALLEWIEHQFEVAEHDLTILCKTLGTFPAIRRTYKKWLTEQVLLDPQSAHRFFESAINGNGLAHHFVDDTLVSLLRSGRGAELLEYRSSQLVDAQSGLLLRIMHLLRVGCVRTPSWAGESPNVASIMCVPDGDAWASLLKTIRDHLAQFTEGDYPQIVSFVEDWSRGVSWQSPYPDGSEYAAAIILDLLPHFDGYRSEDQRKRLLSILVKIPLSRRNRFLSLLERNDKGEKRTHFGKNLEGLILNSMEGFAVCRDLPDDIVELARRKFILTNQEAKNLRRWSSSGDMEPLFGLKVFSHDFFPASAFRGPFLFLLRSHPSQALAFIVELINHATESYANSQHLRGHVEPPMKIQLTLSDGTTRMQWANDRLWNLYRGTSVGPCLLQSALMALESWLLALRESQPHALDEVLIRLLQDSNSAAITAVVASLVTVSPSIAVEAGIVLLRSPECIFLDRLRMAHEARSPGRLDIFPQLDTTKKIYNNERKDADAMDHRQKDLEFAAIYLQTTTAIDRVQAILDEHRSSLPPLDQQDDHVRSWRLSLDRMDLRRYRATTRGGQQEHREQTDGSDFAPDSEKIAVFLELESPAPDIQEMVDRSAQEYSEFNRNIGMLMWGIGVFERNEKMTADSSEWRNRLEVAQQLEGEGENTLGGIDQSSSAKAYVAAVCVRDHWTEIEEDDREWCISTICDAVEACCNVADDFASCQLYPMSGDRPAAYIVSALWNKELSDTQRTRVCTALAQALTHGIDEVGEYAASGASENLWSTDAELALRCVNSLAWQAEILQQHWNEESQKRYDERRSIEALKADSVASVRAMIEGSESVDEQAYSTFNTTGWIGAHALLRLLLIAKGAPTSPVSVQLYRRATVTLQHWWARQRSYEDNDSDSSDDRPYQIESTITTLLERFVLRVEAEDALLILTPILEEIEENPREVSMIIRGLTAAEDILFQPEKFWSIWDHFAARIRDSQLISTLDDSRYYSGDELISAIFLGSWWKDEVRHWRSLEGFADRIHNLFLALPPSAMVLDDYVRFLYHIGEQSMPRAFVHVASRLQEGTPSQLLSKDNTVFMLESLLRRYVYGRPWETKRDRRVREAVLFLLDTLVDTGSSAAYRMRDDFVTPIAT